MGRNRLIGAGPKLVVEAELWLRRVLSVMVAALMALMMSGCAVMDAINEQIEKREQVKRAAFPDQMLLGRYVDAVGKPAPGYVCESCAFYLKRPEDTLFFLTINRKGPRVHDTRALVAMNAAQPIESTDVGRLFIQNARQRGNAVSVYGAPVNKRMVMLGRPAQPSPLPGAWQSYDASSALIELDPSGAFVSVLAVGYELSYGVIRTDSPESKDVFTDQRVYLFPQPTARFIQERLGSSFAAEYQVR